MQWLYNCKQYTPTVHVQHLEGGAKVAEHGGKHAAALCADEGDAGLVAEVVDADGLCQGDVSRQDHHLG